MKRIAGGLALKMADMLGEGYYLEFDLSDIEYLTEDESVKADTANKMLSTHTLNEVRAKVFDLPPLPDGDKTPGIPVFSGFGAPTQTQEPTAQEPQLSAPIIDAQPEEKFVNTKAIERADSFLKSNGGKWWEQRQQIENEATSKAEEKLAVLIAGMLKQQGKIAAAIFSKSEKSYSKKETPRELKKRITQALSELETDYVKWLSDNLSAVVEAGYDSALTLPFEIPNQEAINVIRSRNTDRRFSTLQARNINSFYDINKHTTDNIMKAIGEGLANSDSISKISKAIEEVAGGKLSIGRAARIARTESLTATSIGQAAAMRDAERATGEKFKKMWITANDDRVRDLHAESHGEVVEGGKKFSTGLSYPREPGGEPENVINCRCSWVMVPESEADRLDDWRDEIKTDEEV
jgi:uncharacterized protein with gpF-like domain